MNNDLQLDSLIKNMASEHKPELPSPGLIWWRAQIQKKLAEKERIERPIAIMRMLAVAACLVIALGLLVANWGQLTAGGQMETLVLLAVIMLIAFVLLLPVLFRESANKR